MGLDFAMDDFSNVNPAGKPLQLRLDNISSLNNNKNADIVYQSPSNNISSNTGYQKVKFKDIFDTDTSASASTSDTEAVKSVNGNMKKAISVSFSDLVLQERAKLRTKFRQNTSLTRFDQHHSSQHTNTKFTNYTITNPKKQSINKISSPEKVLRRSPSTIDALCDDSVSVINEEEEEEEANISKVISTPTRYIHASKKISVYPSFTRRLSNNATLWISKSNNNYVTFNKNHLYKKFNLSRRMRIKRLMNMESKHFSITKNHPWHSQNNLRSDETSDSITEKVNKDGIDNRNDLGFCKSCNVYCGKIRTLEADLAVEKQHFEEMCKSNSQLQQKLDNAFETIEKMTKQHNHKLNIKESKIRQLADRNMELLKRIEININDINYFKNCLLDNHNNLESLQSKLNELTNENADLSSCVDNYKVENEKLIKDCSYYKKQCMIMNDKYLQQQSTIKLPQTQNLCPTVTHIETLVPMAKVTESVTADTFTDETANEIVTYSKDIEIKLPTFMNMSGFDKSIFPSFIPSNSALSSTDTDEQHSYHQKDCQRGDKMGVLKKICDMDETDINDLADNVANKCIVNRNLDDSKYNQPKLSPLPPLLPPLPAKITENPPTEIPYNPTTRWILDRVSRPSNLESLFKLQDRIRDMSLRM